MIDKQAKMEIGSRVRCVDNNGYPSLTQGKVYEVIDFQPSIRYDDGFNFPAYVAVVGDSGFRVSAHPYRFVTSEGNL